MNLGNPVFQDLAVRQALYYAMDKKSIIDAIYYGLPTAHRYVPARRSPGRTTLICLRNSYDPAKAKQILDAAGWKAGAGGIREKNGVKLSFTNSTTAGNHVREQAQQLLQQTWREIGADMQIKNMPAAVIWGDYYNLSSSIRSWSDENYMTGPDPDVTVYYASKSIPAKGGAGTNTMQYVNPESGRTAYGGRHNVGPGEARADLSRDGVGHPRRPADAADIPVRPDRGRQSRPYRLRTQRLRRVQLLEHRKVVLGHLTTRWRAIFFAGWGKV